MPSPRFDTALSILAALIIATPLLPTVAHAQNETTDPETSTATTPAPVESPEDLAAARRAFNAGVARAVSGAALTGGAFALIPAMTEYNLGWGREQDVAFLAGTMPMLLTAGLPLLISGIGHHASTRHLPYELRGASMRSRLAQGLTVPWAIFGGLMGTGAMVYAIEFGGEGIVSTPALLAAASGWSLVGMSGALALDGDRAMAELGAPLGRRDNFLRFGIPMLALGSITVFAVAPAVRTGQKTAREEPEAIIGLIGAGSGMMAAGGIALAAGALQHAPRPDFLARRAAPVRLLAAAPSVDLENKRVSFTLVGTFR